ncbi:MAG: hypothetical protein IKC43_06205 [Clostridia bacterium]|nr:hypothetical protein [Clostridia bacterium]
MIESAIKAGVKSYVVEQDVCPGDSFDSLKISSDYLHANFMESIPLRDHCRTGNQFMQGGGFCRACGSCIFKCVTQ